MNEFTGRQAIGSCLVLATAFINWEGRLFVLIAHFNFTTIEDDDKETAPGRWCLLLIFVGAVGQDHPGQALENQDEEIEFGREGP